MLFLFFYFSLCHPKIFGNHGGSDSPPHPNNSRPTVNQKLYRDLLDTNLVFRQFFFFFLRAAPF